MHLAVDFGVLVLILGLGYMGWRRGFWPTAIALAGVILGYVGAYFLYEPVGRVIARVTRLQSVMAFATGGAMVFFLIVGIAMVIRHFVVRHLEDEDEDPSFPDALAGAIIGGTYGGGVAILAVGALNLLNALDPEMNIERSIAARMAVPVCEAITEAVVMRTSESPVLARTAARLIARPAQTRRDIETVFNDERVADLLQDRRAIKALATGDPRVWEKNQRLQDLAEDPAFSHSARGAGLMLDLDTEGALNNPTEQLGRSLMPVARTVQTLSNDPEVQRLLADPHLAAAARDGNLGALLNDPHFNRLATIVLARLREDKVAPQATEAQ